MAWNSFLIVWKLASMKLPLFPLSLSNCDILYSSVFVVSHPFLPIAIIIWWWVPFIYKSVDIHGTIYSRLLDIFLWLQTNLNFNESHLYFKSFFVKIFIKIMMEHFRKRRRGKIRNNITDIFFIRLCLDNPFKKKNWHSLKFC